MPKNVIWRKNKMKSQLREWLVIGLVTLFMIGLVSAITEQEINEAKSLLDSKISCDNLTDEQLEIIGEYYMEQMHPGEAHKLMHKMMGLEEGSETEKQFHISMAKTVYCGESGGMMNSGTGGMMSSGMMGSGMMSMMGGRNMMGYGGYGGMMGSGYGWGWSIFGVINYLLIVALVVAAIYWLIKNAKNRK